ncbi:hypothetical protein QN362_16430 [Actimicrobium sp. CCC2.4]|uniref:hypothetical protein n=1 Tax=Actimicrobium sp. CCC2.4 TaxID=3048606 RepID=UPI002AC9CFC6|nr:hypothetical protein [Actimicrobium sp. CCC2.4]MEB0136924.1 hypothetical protein [Actimicrobium sp. CCC2.4]WPX33471.1 hypothetical protein RHM62_06455 [Actimicrobium sp. CCC2.4]
MNTPLSPTLNATAIAAMASPTLISIIGKLEHENVHQCWQVACFQHQIFVWKTECRLRLPDSDQGGLGEDFAGVQDVASAPKTRVAGHERDTKSARGQLAADESTLFFDKTKVPAEIVVGPNLEIAGLTPSQYEVIGESASYRLAQRQHAFVFAQS